MGIAISLLILLFVNNSYGQAVIWSDDFSTYATPSGITGSGTVNVGDYPASVTKWTLNVSSCSLTEANDYFAVRTGVMEARDVDGPALWTSQTINISGHDNVKLSIYLTETGTMEADDSIHVYYKIDAGAVTSLGGVYDDFGNTTLSIDELSGTNLTIYVYADNDDAAEYLRFDNVVVTYIEKKDLFYYVSDADNNLYIVNRLDGTCKLRGANGVSDIESIANWPAKNNQVLYACDGGTLGTINTTTGAFTSINDVDVDGAAQGSDGSQYFSDIDGLTFDPRSGMLWASHRRNGDYDLLFQINPATGKYIRDAFGTGVDYIVIAGSGVYMDFDDMAISPEDGTLYGVSNDGSQDQILTINKLTGAVSVVSSLATATDVEGLGFSNDNHMYGTMGNDDDFIEIDWVTGTSTTINSNLLGTGDPEAIAALVEDANLIEGRVYDDANLNSTDDSEAGLANVEVLLYFDVNADGLLDAGDEYLTTTETDASGDYHFDYASIGSLVIVINESSLPSGYSLTTSNLQVAVFASQGNTESGNDFGAASGSDCDGNGIPDFTEGTSDPDGDGVQNECDLDNDNDGILDSEEGTQDSDGDGIANMNDLDSDNDGIPDAIEANNGAVPSGYNSSTGRIAGTDTDGDGLLNSVDNAPSTAYTISSTSTLPRMDHDGDGIKDFQDRDSDNDGILDVVEAGGTDSNKDGIIDGFSDSNSDGLKDGLTTSPLPIPNSDSSWETTYSLASLPNYIDQDTDNDGIDDTTEGYSTAQLTYPSITSDSDGDGIINLWDNSNGGTSITPNDNDGDGTPDYIDLDTDDDGTVDEVEGDDDNNDNTRDGSPSNQDVNYNGIDDAFDSGCSGVSGINVIAADYAEENNSNGSMNLTSSDLELVNDGTTHQTVGVYFSGVNLNQGQTISKAYIQFQADETSSTALTVTLKGEDIDNSSAFTSTAYNASSRTTTTASVSWTPGNWTTVGEASTNQRTGELRTIVQEIVDRGGWVNGNGMTFLITGANNSAVKRTAEVNPTLHVEITGTLSYTCGTVIALQDEDSDGEKDWRDDESDGDPLPVNLVSQVAKLIDNEMVRIEWQTASEHLSSIFIIEKSTDLLDFERVGTLNAKGESNILINYETFDYSPGKGIVYYRITQVDIDGKLQVFPVMPIEINQELKIELYPNPASDVITINSNSKVDIDIYGISGNLVFQQKSILGKSEIDVFSWSKGVYTIRYTSAIETKSYLFFVGD